MALCDTCGLFHRSVTACQRCNGTSRALRKRRAAADASRQVRQALDEESAPAFVSDAESRRLRRRTRTSRAIDISDDNDVEHVADLADAIEIDSDVQVQHVGSLFDAAPVPEPRSALPAVSERAAPPIRDPRGMFMPRITAIAPPHRVVQSESPKTSEASSPQLQTPARTGPPDELRRARPFADPGDVADAVQESPVPTVRALWNCAPGALPKLPASHRHASSQPPHHDKVMPGTSPACPRERESSVPSWTDMLPAPLQVPINGLSQREPHPGPTVPIVIKQRQTTNSPEPGGPPETSVLAEARHELVQSLPVTPETRARPPGLRKVSERARSPRTTPVPHARPNPRQRRNSSPSLSGDLPDASGPLSLQHGRIDPQPSRSGRYSIPIPTRSAPLHEEESGQSAHVASLDPFTDALAAKERTSSPPPRSTPPVTRPFVGTRSEQMIRQPFQSPGRNAAIRKNSASPLEEASIQPSRPAQPNIFARRTQPQERVNRWPSRGALLGRRRRLFGVPRANTPGGGSPLPSGMGARASGRDAVLPTNEVGPETSLGRQAGIFSPVSNSAIRESTDLDRSAAGTSGAGVRTGRGASSQPRDEHIGKQAHKFIVKASCRYGWESSVHVLAANYSVKFVEFHRLLGEAFDMRVAFAFCYFDDDGDRVIVSSDVEMEAMLDFVSKRADRLRIKMTPPHGYTSSP